MADQIQQARMRDPERLTEATVLSAIRYLDSPTDYREYLPYAGHRDSFPGSELVMLDDLPHYVRVWLRVFTLIAILVCVILLLLLRIG